MQAFMQTREQTAVIEAADWVARQYGDWQFDTRTAAWQWTSEEHGLRVFVNPTPGHLVVALLPAETVVLKIDSFGLRTYEAGAWEGTLRQLVTPEPCGRCGAEYLKRLQTEGCPECGEHISPAQAA